MVAEIKFRVYLFFFFFSFIGAVFHITEFFSGCIRRKFPPAVANSSGLAMRPCKGRIPCKPAMPVPFWRGSHPERFHIVLHVMCRNNRRQAAFLFQLFQPGIPQFAGGHLGGQFMLFRICCGIECRGVNGRLRISFSSERTKASSRVALSPQPEIAMRDLRSSSRHQ